MSTKKPSSYEEIVETVKANNNQVINDNPTAVSKQITLMGIMNYKYKDRIIPVGLFGSAMFTLNEVFLDTEGVPHISRHCTCGIFERDMKDPLEEAITKFNNSRPLHQSTAGNVITGYVLF